MSEKQDYKENWEWVDPKLLKKDGENPNRVPKEKMEAIAANIEKYGWNMAIITDMDYIIADGEHKLDIALEKGWELVPVLRKRSIKTAADRKIIRQSMNKLRGTHDEELDAKEIQIILGEKDMEELVNLTGQSEQEVMNLLNKLQQDEKEPQAAKEASRLVHTCPKCGHKFKSEDKN